jgi:hypothetical protein
MAARRSRSAAVRHAPGRMVHCVSRQKINIETMATGSPRNLYGESADQRSKLYWLDIDVNFNDIVRQHRMMSSNPDVRRLPSSLRHSVLRGVGTVANALSVGDGGTTFQHFEVDVAAFVQDDEYDGFPELHRSAKMIWNEVDARSPRLEIYVRTKMLRHLVELYVTKRIDTVIMSMKIAIVRHTTLSTGPGSELLPLLNEDGHLYFRRTQCELLSVHASLARERRDVENRGP